MADGFPGPTFVAALAYMDGHSALDWLEKAFNFERTVVMSNADGGLLHAEMKFGGGHFALGSPWLDAVTSPTAIGSRNTQVLIVHLDDGLDAHHAHAVANGASSVSPPQDQPYGVRTYTVSDLEGHLWTFAMSLGNADVA